MDCNKIWSDVQELIKKASSDTFEKAFIAIVKGAEK